MRTVELLGGPKCGEVITAEDHRPLRLYRLEQPYRAFADIHEPPEARTPPMLEGLYDYVGAKEYERGIMRWQGWR